MKQLIRFIENINAQMGISLPDEWQALPEVEIARRFIQGINAYFFQTRENIGRTSFRGDELKYFSDFHKFWEKHHREILNAHIAPQQVRKAAEALSKAVRVYGKDILNVTHETRGLAPKAIAQVRFFTANQDFREPPENQFDKYLEDPSRFDAQEIANEPEEFLRFLGMTRLSQTDKRLDFARNAARFLIEQKIDAFGLAELFQQDALKIRDALIHARNIGYGAKKANMFVRDMVELGVWTDLRNFDQIDVASDINTMKLALRTRILQTDIPLLSSFLDIFCYQYEYIDEMSALAWRAVWEEWKKEDPETAPRSPCLMDFLLYRIGREYCKDMLVEYHCEKGHTFFYFGGRLRKCRVCPSSRHSSVSIVSKRLPCQVSWDRLPRHENGSLFLSDTNLLHVFDGHCIFETVCQPNTDSFHPFDPPKSISVKGRTGWVSAYADQERGGNGLMS